MFVVQPVHVIVTIELLIAIRAFKNINRHPLHL